MDLDPLEPPPESGEAAEGGKLLKSEPETPPWKSKPPPWESKRVDDVEESELSMYDDYPVPFDFRNKRFLYKNKAMIQHEKEMAEHKERYRKLGPWGVTTPPPKWVCGGVRPYPISDDVRPRLTHFCNLALNKYNADNEGANFVFDDLVKATSSIVAGRMYYITFTAKDASNNTATAPTFQAKVYDKMIPKGVEPQVMLCSMKPT